MAYSIQEKVALIVERVGFNVMRKTLGATLGIKARGVDDFQDKLAQAIQTDTTIAQKIDEYWSGSLSGGQRLIQVYSGIASSDLAKAAQYIEDNVDSASVFMSSYPYPLRDSVLATQNTHLHLCDFLDLDGLTENSNNIKCGVFANKAYYTKVDRLSSSDLSDDGLRLRESGAELFARKRVNSQSYNTIIVDLDRNLLFVSIDLSLLPKSEATIQIATVNRFLRETVQISLGNQTNVFSSISNLYDENEGRIHLVSFLTADGNADTIKLPNVSSTSCVKDDSYHAAGESATRILSKYRVTKFWDTESAEESTHDIGASVHGTKNMLTTLGPLKEFTTENCTSLKEVMYVIDKVIGNI